MTGSFPGKVPFCARRAGRSLSRGLERFLNSQVQLPSATVNVVFVLKNTTYGVRKPGIFAGGEIVTGWSAPLKLDTLSPKLIHATEPT